MNFKYISNFRDSMKFKIIVEEFKHYDWFSDVEVVATKDSNSALIGSLAIQMLPSALMYMIRPNILPIYNESTLKASAICCPMIYHIQKMYPTHYWLKAQAVGLLSKSKQDNHIDNLFWHANTLRLVLPIIFNSQCYTIMNDIKYYLQLGTLYEMDNLQFHHSVNMGDEIRTYLFFDLVPFDKMSIIEKYYTENGIRKFMSVG